MTLEPILEISHLSKRFGALIAVSDLSFAVSRGEIFGFLGPNGAGKTTTIRCIMDFIRPTSGTITVDGFDSTKHASTIKIKVGYVSSEPQLYDHWNGNDHISFVEHTNGKRLSKELAQRLDFNTKTRIKQLSTGNRQKLAVVFALMTDPDLLILDEPTRGLDPLWQQEIYLLLRDFQSRGGTVFMSSHNLAEVEHICDRVGIIREGKLITVASVKDLKGQEVHLIRIAFGQPVKKIDINLSNSEITELQPTIFSMRIKGDLNPFLKLITKYNVKDLEITHASLEEIFLTYYKKQEK